ncbi:protein ACTIVITY OF BC1 COMPLEX KINASE 3, chloroplastic [Selaginella moellendorffii]|uniref:protein ACTIVITY OF BC1 COMPLEX KINASE 3, chloroplastic n=1 Tax=Selaginella moellendorffii TaxID=88036 RepID=UPI000D1C39DD|nr:protein ACTIVITY OF BC1 COMPLEX KINASE 3, chloroplastic [Selaginella moellendorffii]|eukprot:XP_002991477.2 protein ACTIVITY OF BC1 COMPLEX KINASE 3, chloroplastic [Selaginella moellendorffii]
MGILSPVFAAAVLTPSRPSSSQQQDVLSYEAGQRLYLDPRAGNVSAALAQNYVKPTVSRAASQRNDDAEAEARALARAVNAPKYDPAELSRRYGGQPLQVTRRTLNILLELGSFAADLYLDKQRGELERNKRVRAIQLRQKLTKLGPTFVKIGQGLSTRPDLCPPEYLEELAELQDALPTFPDAEAFSWIESELGARLEDVYSSITPSPVAAASLGQVYKAVLRSTGEVVAVKVQRPGIAQAIGLDFFLLRNVCQLIDKYVDVVTTNVVALLDEFASRVYQELNYVQEGFNAKKFMELYGDRVDVKVPSICWDYTSVKVLTMEWIDGTKLSEQEVIESQGLNVLKMVDIGIQCSLRQLLEYGYFHADPHPGNLLATPEGKLAFIDFGMMSDTPPQARFAIIGHVVHMVNRDYEAMARDYYALDFLSPDVDVSPIVPALKSFFDDVLDATVSELNFKTIVDGLGAVLYQYPFDVPPYYALILRSLTVLEGLALYTDPNFKVLAAAYPYFAKRLLTDPNPYLRDALVELLFKDGSFRWQRLENLLVQGRKSSDFVAKDALQPVLQLMLGEEGAELRRLVEKEAVRVLEALVIGSTVEGYKSLPEPLKFVVNRGNNGRVIALKEQEEAQMLKLRQQVLRVWGLLRTSSGFDPAMLQPVVEILRLPEAQSMGAHVATGLTKRLAARLLQQLLKPATPLPA